MGRKCTTTVICPLSGTSVLECSLTGGGVTHWELTCMCTDTSMGLHVFAHTRWPLSNPDFCKQTHQMHQVVFLACLLDILWDPVRAPLQNDQSVSQVFATEKERKRGRRGEEREWIPLFVLLFVAAVSIFMLSPHDCRQWWLSLERFLLLDFRPPKARLWQRVLPYVH